MKAQMKFKKIRKLWLYYHSHNFFYNKKTMKETIVINLIGGPGSGKSTIASGLFYNLKKNGIDCEMALEFAKDKVWEESYRTLDDQIYVFGKQYHRLWKLLGKVDVIITDSPLLLSAIYNKEQSDYFEDFIIEQFKKFNNKVYFIERNPSQYQENGRMQNLEEAIEIDEQILDILKRNNISFINIINEKAVDFILSDILKS